MSENMNLDQPEEGSFFCSPEWTTEDKNDYGACPACAGSGRGGRMVVDERTGDIRCNCCGHYAAV